MHTYTYVHAYISTSISYVHAYISISIYLHVYLHTCVYIHTYRNFGGVVEHTGYDGRVLVSQHLTAHALEASAKEIGVALQLIDLLAAL